ncbi:transcription termination factor Rho [Rhodococcus sp. ARC_M6]|uniref:transcription termination factor Rho n=1 Tax=Rhodococcus sp. ARC_M6 TaxID=2928852 RepID=UPI001FB2489B|nr:transcription termination factor Rho [Rhodococcus sp. ARC_M6]MCJ0906678.1 transcription termination factor Rho [Rhodococcus sp. ARC_M6]
MTDTDLIATTAPSAGAHTGDNSQASSSAPDGAVATSTKRADARRGAGLSGMVLTELRSLAGELGIKGTSGMRKGDLIAAIKERQGGSSKASPAQSELTLDEAPVARTRTKSTRAPRNETAEAPAAAEPAEAPAVREASAPRTETSEDADAGTPRRGRQRRGASRRSGSPDQPELSIEPESAPVARESDAKSAEAPAVERKQNDRAETKSDSDQAGSAEQTNERPRRERNNRDNQGQRDGQGQRGNQDRQDRGNQNNAVQGAAGQGTAGPRNDNRNNGPDDDDENGRGRRGRRFRERRGRGRERGEGTTPNDARETEIREDDVLQPVAGILDVLDNYAFVRTSGYLAGPNDVYVSMNLIRKNGLRRGDAITGAVRVSSSGGGGDQSSQRQKFNPLVRIDTVNGGDIEAAKKRPEFNKLTPLYPNQRLRLETEQNILTTRVIDLVMPIGKGQRALIVSPPKAGKTSVLQAIANAIATNNPECYLMVVLVDERPEEVTDMQRSVKGEVISSTFDRPPGDHTSVAELAIERAKRLVEMGKDVVVLLDSITRLGRAYNNSSPASGRILSGGVDSTALYPPKRFLGAARNIEHGGSLTIIATAMVETGSTGDTVIFEEFKGTGNAELKLDRKIAERRVFPAVDVNPSGTRKDELLLSPDEAAVLHKLRRVLSGLDSHQAIDLLIDRLKKSKNNLEFLMQVSKTAPGAIDD